MNTLIEYLNEERGRRTQLAKALNINPAAISQWSAVPATRVVEVEALTGIPRDILRPDIFREKKKRKAGAQ